ncbi:hypothetical protein H4R18_004046 [Coemansia javaensis]|uniref:P-type ATPase A domain-containing protein n=1 Tax=Coemansia javaensis TaxID=2761396 RepID=A0A9W8H5C4_9FUNG|nr:hypothetical protein H4R18_004046 [Coemansia javaensis]
MLSTRHSVVNKYDVHGQVCPRRTRIGRLCPQLCVSSVALCPAGLGDEGCPSGERVCIDGSCRADCSGVPGRRNPCGCSFQNPPEQSRGLVPCLAFPEVAIEQYSSGDADGLVAFCSRRFNVSGPAASRWGEWGTAGDGVGRRFWAGGQCPAAPRYRYTYREPLWLAVFSCVGLEAAILLAWFAYKHAHEAGVRRLRRGGFQLATLASPVAATSDVYGSSAEKTGAAAKTADGPRLHIRGFNDHPLGTVGLASVVAVSLGWLVWMAVWTCDNYAVLGDAYMLAHYNTTLLEETMIPLWTFAVAWFATCCVLLPRLRNIFRVESLPAASAYVQVERKLRPLQMGGPASGPVALAKRVEEAVARAIRADMHVQTCRVERTAHTGRRYFEYMCTRYVLDEDTAQFAARSLCLGTTHSQLRRHAGGLGSREAAARLELVGANSIEVHVPGYFAALAHELSGVLILYQLLVMWLYYFWQYYAIGLIDTAIILVSAGARAAFRVRGELQVKRAAEQCEPCDIMRDGKWQRLSTVDLVPGDVIRLAPDMRVGCDAVVLGGAVVVDESTVTGEPLPVRKVPICTDGGGGGDGAYDPHGAGRASTLFAGTRILQSQAATASDGTASDPVALCLYTGTQTEKGRLVQQILFPQPVSFTFDEELRLVFGILLVCSVVIFAMALAFYQSKPSAAWFYAQFSCSSLVNPLLPAALVMGQTVAAARLKEKRIRCVDLSRIVLAGKVSVLCLDKTGTLTRDKIEFYGCLCAQGAGERPLFEPFTEDFGALPSRMQTALSVCHGVGETADGLRIGHPVDLEMFQATRCGLAAPSSPGVLCTVVAADGRARLDVVRRFDFVHARASMSVVVRDERTGQLHVFVKGSFERLKAISRPDTVPADYDAACSRLAREGCYVLSVAHRIMDATLEELRNMSQEDIEAGCGFIGLLVFKNMLKDDTEQAIGELKRGSTRTAMITGDTALTGVYIARQCGMAPAGSPMLLGDVDKETGELFWTDVDTDERVADIGPHLAEKDQDGFSKAELAVTCAAFRLLDERGEMAPLLLDTRVFARMKPDDKVRCIQLHMERGITAMCGDGGNDCGALRAAHVGLALSDAEASIVSPFASSDRSIMACVELLVQGRSAQATSFASYLYLILYGQTLTLVKVFTFYFSNTVSTSTWILIDAFINTGMSACVACSKPARRLARWRPTARILGPQVLATALGTVAINWCTMAAAFAWLYRKPWFRCNEFAAADADISKWWLLADSYEAATLAVVCLFQLASNAMVVNFGYLHRRAWWRNWPLVSLWAGCVALVSTLLLADANWLGCRFRINCGSKAVLAREFGIRLRFGVEDYSSALGHNVIPRSSRLELWAICIGGICAALAWQLAVVLYPVHSLARRRWPSHRAHVKL